MSLMAARRALSRRALSRFMIESMEAGMTIGNPSVTFHSAVSNARLITGNTGATCF